MKTKTDLGKYARPWPWVGYEKLGTIYCNECPLAICSDCEEKGCYKEDEICTPNPPELRLSHRHGVYIKDGRISIWWNSMCGNRDNELQPAGNLYCRDCDICEEPHWHRVYTLNKKSYINWKSYYLDVNDPIIRFKKIAFPDRSSGKLSDAS